MSHIELAHCIDRRNLVRNTINSVLSQSITWWKYSSNCRNPELAYGVCPGAMSQRSLMIIQCCPDSKVHGANMGPIWGRQDPGGLHFGPMNVAIWVHMFSQIILERYLNFQTNAFRYKPVDNFLIGGYMHRARGHQCEITRGLWRLIIWSLQCLSKYLLRPSTKTIEALHYWTRLCWVFIDNSAILRTKGRWCTDWFNAMTL